MTAAEAIHLASTAGLRLEPVADGLQVRGPRRARAFLVPLLMPLVDDILKVLGTVSVPVQSLAERTSVLGDRPPCDGCGRVDWMVSVIMEDHERYCRRCLIGDRR